MSYHIAWDKRRAVPETGSMKRGRAYRRFSRPMVLAIPAPCLQHAVPAPAVVSRDMLRGLRRYQL